MRLQQTQLRLLLRLQMQLQPQLLLFPFWLPLRTAPCRVVIQSAQTTNILVPTSQFTSQFALGPALSLFAHAMRRVASCLDCIWSGTFGVTAS